MTPCGSLLTDTGREAAIPMDPEDIELSTVELRWDIEDGLVEVKSGGSWHQMSPDDARELANGYEQVFNSAKELDTGDARKFVRLLRDYANKAEAA